VNPYAAHVERVADPHELRWVLNWPELAAAPDGRRVPPASSAIGRLLATRSIRAVRVLSGDLVVRADAWDSELTATVHEAVLGDRQHADRWWFETAAAVSVRRGT
jgi:hypothetical protein